MNRKLLVIAMVPLLVGFAGAMAFSGWQGSITKTITVNTGYVKVSEKVECVGANIQGYVVLWPSYSIGSGSIVPLKPIVLDGGDGGGYGGGYGGISKCPTFKECYVGDWCSDPGALSLSGGDSDPIVFLGPGISTAHYYLTIQYLAPGDWIELMLVDQADPSGGSVSLTSTLTPSGLAATLPSGLPGSLAPASGPGFVAANLGGWTWLKDAPANPCKSAYVPTPGIIDVGASTSPSSTIGLEYCDSGTLAPGAPSGSALSPAAGPVTVGGGFAYTYLLLGLDQSATGLSNSGMGMTGTLTYQVVATAPS